jgi:hypothetical protein
VKTSEFGDLDVTEEALTSRRSIFTARTPLAPKAQQERFTCFPALGTE